MEITAISDIDNIIIKNMREIQVINIDKINSQIKMIEIDHRPMFNFMERIIYFNHIKQDKKMQKLIMPCCCTKCGNYMSTQYSKIQCDCNQQL